MKRIRQRPVRSGGSGQMDRMMWVVWPDEDGDGRTKMGMNPDIPTVSATMYLVRVQRWGYVRLRVGDWNVYSGRLRILNKWILEMEKGTYESPWKGIGSRPMTRVGSERFGGGLKRQGSRQGVRKSWGVGGQTMTNPGDNTRQPITQQWVLQATLPKHISNSWHWECSGVHIRPKHSQCLLIYFLRDSHPWNLYLNTYKSMNCRGQDLRGSSRQGPRQMWCFELSQLLTGRVLQKFWKC